ILAGHNAPPIFSFDIAEGLDTQDEVHDPQAVSFVVSYGGEEYLCAIAEMLFFLYRLFKAHQYTELSFNPVEPAVSHITGWKEARQNKEKVATEDREFNQHQITGRRAQLDAPEASIGYHFSEPVVGIFIALAELVDLFGKVLLLI
ncbi:hypothetical protein BHE90_017457, partial [Fusarium euwallaceae]